MTPREAAKRGHHDKAVFVVASIVVETDLEVVNNSHAKEASVFPKQGETFAPLPDLVCCSFVLGCYLWGYCL